MNQIGDIAAGLAEYARKNEYKGYDPYDTLNSPLAGFLSLGTRFGRIALTQFGRRSPINLRPLLLVKKGINPKALALFLEGSTKLFKVSQDEKYLDDINTLIDLLEQSASTGVSGNAWGYKIGRAHV